MHIHLVSAIPNGLILEYYSTSTDPLHREMFEETLQVEDGHVRPPNRPGLGIVPNMKVLERYRVA